MAKWVVFRNGNPIISGDQPNNAIQILRQLDGNIVVWSNAHYAEGQWYGQDGVFLYGFHPTERIKTQLLLLL